MSATRYQGSSPIVVAIWGWGDQIVGRALALLLRSSGYKTRFLPASSSSAPGGLNDVQLLLLAPMPELSTERQEALLAPLKDTPRGSEIPVLELVMPSEGSQAGAAAWDYSWHLVPWPCRVKELERRIEAALAGDTQQLPLSYLP